MARGKVKWFNEAKGYGFIRIDGKGDMGPQSDREIFVHHTDIVMEGFKTLQPDASVEFDIYEQEKDGVMKKIAKNVKVV